MEKKSTILDLSGCQYIGELHDRIQKALHFPEYYGRNLDALWDCLHCECDMEFVSIVGIETVAEDLKPTIQIILNMFEENKQEWIGTDCPFDYEIL